MAGRLIEPIVKKVFSQAGITVNGNKPWDIQVHNTKLYSALATKGSLGLGEAYMNGWWTAKSPDEFVTRLLRADLDKKGTRTGVGAFFGVLKSKILNLQSLKRSVESVEHYNLSNEFYEAMLDPFMQYTCAYWKDAKTLNKAQTNKLDLICKKLKLKKGDKVLELGSGWGGFARYAAKKYGCEITCYNISREQVKYARKKSKGLKIKIVQDDYRNAKGQYDKVVAIGLFEHIGYKNYKTFLSVAHRCLKDDGLLLVHTIGKDLSVTSMEPWLNKYIFPNSNLPSLKQVTTAAEGLFIMEDWHNFGQYYDKTLLAWNENFKKNWHKFEKKFGERFFRMWEYYLLCCAAVFRARKAQLWHIVFSKGNLKKQYQSVR